MFKPGVFSLSENFQNLELHIFQVEFSEPKDEKMATSWVHTHIPYISYVQWNDSVVSESNIRINNRCILLHNL